MKNKIIAFLSVLFLIFAIGAAISMRYIMITTSELEKIITLHSVEILRQDLIIKIQKVEEDLLTVHTELARQTERIVANVNALDRAINHCNACHHSPIITEKLNDIRAYTNKFETSLSHYIAGSPDEGRIRLLKMEAYATGAELLKITSNMAVMANERLQQRTRKAIEDVGRAQQILIITLMIAFLIALWIAVNLTRNILNPVKKLIDVTRRIESGDLGYTTDYQDSTEFGELAASINDMSVSLRESNTKSVQYLNRLAGLYRITLPFHAVSNISEVFSKVSLGIAELVDVEQCGLMLLDAKEEWIEQRYPASGNEVGPVGESRVGREDIIKLYFSSNRRPLIINDIDGLNSLPTGLLMKGEGPLRNMLLGWVRLKGEIIGVIRLANKKTGNFAEEEARLIGIISNNISVAIENAKLYEDLKAQMKELKETQEQLVQAAKLAAIGELASNVAHEINNPLTSIMGYAELIKEETDLGNIMSDIDVIERESMRARDIVQQLLEFARRRPLEIKEIDINSLMRDAVSLVSIQLKDERIQIMEHYSKLPMIMGDPNQLKQVFLNLINNAIHAISENGGDISISSRMKDAYVVMEIADTGHGISGDVLPKIFEPFFTTKREQGTGLGLSITYKIIQSHKGAIDVKSEEGNGTTFTISLPMQIFERVPAYISK